LLVFYEAWVCPDSGFGVEQILQILGFSLNLLVFYEAWVCPDLGFGAEQILQILGFSSNLLVFYEAGVCPNSGLVQNNPANLGFFIEFVGVL
jgi:hypothetical protein